MWGYLHEHLVIWEKMSDRQRNMLCWSERLHPRFIQRHWDEMSPDARLACCYVQKLCAGFIKRKWKKMSPKQKEQCCWRQDFTREFTMNNWFKMTCRQKRACIEGQRIMEKLSRADLPIFFADPHDFVRCAAAERLR